MTATDILEQCFWKVSRDPDTGTIRKIHIDQLQFCEFLYSAGFRRFDIEDDHIFVQIVEDRIIKPVTITHIQDYVYSWLDELPGDVDGEGLTPAQIKVKILSGVSFYFNKQRLFYLKPRQPIIFNRDTIISKYVYYLNGYVKITAGHIEFNTYDQLSGYIWHSQQLQRSFVPGIPIKGRNMVRDFLYYVSGHSKNRMDDLCIAIGYYLHDFTDYKLKALLLTDSGSEDEQDANGRTGKTLFCRLIGHMITPDPNDPTLKTYVEINGKDFDPRDKHKYSACSIDTKLVIINDLKRFFDVDLLYNDITEGLTVDRKNMQPFKIRPKIILTTNKTVKIEGRSSADRFIEFEFSEYFNAEHTPENEFGHWFFRDWSQLHWNCYDIVMHQCIQQYFQNGTKLNDPEQINLNARKLTEQTSPEFLEFVREVWRPHTNQEYDKRHYFELFRSEFPDFANPKFSQRRFTQWFKYFCNFTPGIDNYKKSTHERRSATGSCYVFHSSKPGMDKIV